MATLDASSFVAVCGGLPVQLAWEHDPTNACPWSWHTWGRSWLQSTGSCTGVSGTIVASAASFRVACLSCRSLLSYMPTGMWSFSDRSQEPAATNWAPKGFQRSLRLGRGRKTPGSKGCATSMSVLILVNLLHSEPPSPAKSNSRT